MPSNQPPTAFTKAGTDATTKHVAPTMNSHAIVASSRTGVTRTSLLPCPSPVAGFLPPTKRSAEGADITRGG